MAKQKFGSNLISKTAANQSASNELRKLESDPRDLYTFQYVDYNLIDPNDKNDFPMEKVEELKESIKENGLFQALTLRPTEDGRYRIIAGEQRFRAIGKLLEEDPNRFTAGIPAKIESMELSEIDEEIKLREDNIVRRNNSPEIIRKNLARLKDLYSAKNESEGKNMSVIHQIAEKLNVSERQVQRINAINERLIPELTALYDEKKISTENAAKFSNMDEETQKMVFELIQTNNNITPAEIQKIKAESDKEKALIEENLRKSEKEKQELEALLKEKEEASENLAEQLNQKEEQLQLEHEKALEQIESLQMALEEAESLDDLKQIEELRNQLNAAKMQEQQRIDKEKALLQKLEEAQKEAENLRKKINNDPELNPELIKKVREETELTNLLNELKKSSIILQRKLEGYKKNYNVDFNTSELHNIITLLSKI